jgi:hypothetical protein
MKNNRNRRKDVTLGEKFHFLALAIDEMSSRQPDTKYKTDVIGIACQYSSQPKLKREDFKELAGMSIKQIMEELHLNIKA